MGLDNGKISSGQLIFMTASFIQAALFINALLLAYNGRDSWLLLAISFVIFIPVIVLYAAISKRFPASNIMQINEKVFGTAAGKILSALYIIYYFMIAALNLKGPSNYLTSIFLEESPDILFSVFIVLILMWSVKSGIEVIARLGYFTFFIAFISSLVIAILLLPKFETKHFFPILDMPLKKIVQVILITLSQLLSEIYIFLMVLPNISDKKNIKKAIFLGTLIGTVSLILIAVTTVAVLGNTMYTQLAPYNEAARQIQTMNITARIEILVLFFLFFSNFMKNAVIMYALVLSVSYVFKLRSYKPIILPVGILVLALSNIMFRSAGWQSQATRNSWVFVALLFQIILPLATFVTALIKAGKAGGDA